MINKRTIVFASLLIIAIFLSACSTTPKALTEEQLAEKKEEVLVLLNSDEDQSMLDGIALVKELELQNDPDVCELLIGFLDNFREDAEMRAFILSSFLDVPQTEDSKCETALLEQFIYAGDHGLNILETDIYQTILAKNFDENQELYEAYLNLSLEDSNAEKLNEYLILASTFASEEQLIEMIAPFKESSYLRVNDINQETALILYLRYLNRASNGSLQSDPDYMDLSKVDRYALRVREIIRDEGILLNQNDIDNLGTLLTNEVLMDIEYINSKNGSFGTISTVDTILTIFDSGPAAPVCQWSVAYLESLEGNEVAQLEYGNDKEDMEETIIQALHHLDRCELQVRSDAYCDFFMKSADLGSTTVQKILIEELVKLDRKDAADAISDYIKTWLNSGWAFEEYETLLYQLMDLDPQVGIETALYFMTFQEPGIRSNTVYYISDDITKFVIEMIQEEQIALDEQLVDTFIEASKTNDAATFRIMKLFTELHFDESEMIPYLMELLETEDPYVRFGAARILSTEYNAGLEVFEPYFENRQLEVVAGAYQVAKQYGNTDLIVEAMKAYGDLTMASYFLNNNGETLFQASKTWGEDHGYRVETIIYN